MKVLCDVHISYKLVQFFVNQGIEAIHVNDILDRWLTKDKDICSYADAEGFVVITKDVDFKNTFLINRSPQKLIKINLGNISNADLLAIFRQNLPILSELMQSACMVEIGQEGLFITR